MENPKSTANHALQSVLELCGHFLYHRRGSRRGQEKILRILSEWEEQGGESHAVCQNGPAPKEEGSGLSQSRLQAMLGVRSGSISEIIGKMEASGLIRKNRQEDDHRRVCLTITPAGRNALRLSQQENDRQEALLFEALTQEEQRELQALLEKLLESWKAHFDPALLQGHCTSCRKEKKGDGSHA